MMNGNLGRVLKELVVAYLGLISEFTFKNWPESRKPSG
jgi:hypothetical protein